ncbi:hypothetical protein [Microvirga sp. VF16]|uniref:hypothetical protein n=1 Tax=Microvirga sp. VF16 TaxID=2807101 RepID=UPI00193E28D5|nr:hypothetical protein [Microvirga sp. VF16]QRM31087.1 hypothetical protein JO965_08885 [Microvirga sp. VF16]
MPQASLIALLILVLVIPWRGAHAGIILAGVAFWIATEMVAPDRKEVSAQASITRTFNANVHVSNEQVNFDERLITAIVHNGSNARVYDVWLRCTFQVPQTQYKATDPSGKKEMISTDYHYSYIAPGVAEQVSLVLEPHGLLTRAHPSSFSCEPRYQYEAVDLFQAGG